MIDVERLFLSDSQIKSGGGFLHQFSVDSTYKLHTHSFYELFLVAHGKAIHCINNTTQLLSEGSFVLIRPDDIHQYDFFCQYDFELINIAFPCELFDMACASALCQPSYFNAPELSPHICLEGYNFTDVKRKLLHFDLREEGLPRKRYLSSLLPLFLYRFLAEPYTSPRQMTVPVWLANLLKAMDIQENYVEGLPCLLRLANMSQEHLTREFRKYLNFTPTEFINAKRMNLVIKLLLETDREVIDICYECGFNNLSHFYRIFLKQFGCPPKKFLERYNDRN